MNLLDEYGLTDGASIPVNIFAKALSLEGYVIRPDERDMVLKYLWANPPEAGKLTVYTGPGALAYWCSAPVTVRICEMPGGKLLPSELRREGIEWLLFRRGVGAAEAKALAVKAPTDRHKHYGLWRDSQIELELWEGLKTLDELPEMEYVGEYEPPPDRDPYDVTLVTNGRALASLTKALEEAVRTGATIGLDVETDEEENYEASLVGIGFAFGATNQEGGESGQRAKGYYLPLNGPLGAEVATEVLHLYFAERECPWWIGHNAKFDAQVLASALTPVGVSPVPLLRRITERIKGDGLIAAYVLAKVDWNTGRPLEKGLKDLAERTFGVRMIDYKEMLGLSGATKSSEAPLKDIGPYCIADAFWGVKVCEKGVQDLRRYPKLQRLYERVELPTVGIVARMEMLGLPIDAGLLWVRKGEATARVEMYRKYLEKQAVKAGHELKVKRKMCPLHSKKKVDYGPCPECDEKGRVMVTEPFNPNSGQQVSAVVQGVFGLPPMAYTDSGEPSNSESALLKLREFTDDEEAKDWLTVKLAWSKDDKVRGTYLEGLWERKRKHPELSEHAPQSRPLFYIHPTFSQAVVESGRFSSKNPNGQNFPLNQRDLFTAQVIRDAWLRSRGIDPRQFAVSLWQMDYSQLELRIFASVTKTRWMLETFADPNGDIHAATAAIVLGIHPKDQNASIRTRAKTLNFGMAYGAQGETVEEQITVFALRLPELNIPIPSLTECRDMVKKYWQRAPEAQEWKDFIIEVVRDRGYSETLYGRRRYLPHIRSNNSELRSGAERQAVNHVIQGTAADIIKQACLMLDEEAPKYGADIRSQIHDELLGLVFGTPGETMKWMQVVERYALLDQPLMPVPLKVEPKLVTNWKEAK